MAQVAPTVLAQDLCPFHAHGAIRDPFHCVRQVVIECWPSTPGIEFCVRTANQTD